VSVFCSFHLWLVLTAMYSPNNTYNVLFNGESDKTGSLLEDFEPAVNPPKEIDDPKDKKPSTWIDEQKIADPEAKKVGFPYPLHGPIRC
jgi:hypothetical protein